jgi:hypothetical protein
VAAIERRTRPRGGPVAFDADGVGVRPAAGDWTWSLRLVAYGYPGAERVASAAPRLTAVGSRVDYDWGEGLTEWWRNGPDGVKQTFVLTQRPASPQTAGPLAITVRVGGSLHARLAEAGQAVTFTDAGGAVRLRYRELLVTDAAGRRVTAWFEATDDRVRLRVDGQAAPYPLTVDPIAQEAYWS